MSAGLKKKNARLVKTLTKGDNCRQGSLLMSLNTCGLGVANSKNRTSFRTPQSEVLSTSSGVAQPPFDISNIAAMVARAFPSSRLFM